MSTPHKATERQWGIVRRRAEVDWNHDSTDSVLVEVADRVAAMEAAATQPPAPAADHSRGATEMVATDDELWSLWANRPRGPLSADNALRAVYNLGRQHSAQPRQGEQPTPPPAPAGGLVEMVAEAYGFPSWKDEARNAIHCVADWLQQRSSTIANGSRWAEVLRAETERSSAAPPRPVPPPPTPAGGLLEEAARLLANRISTMRPGADCTPLARTVLAVVADWMDTKASHVSAAVLRRETNR
jgi:hypothetical protein